jgi:membrane fusion protein, copper/silver efflux system
MPGATFALATCLAALPVSCRRAPQVAHDARRILYYHDPMHPSYRSDRPGIAPDCNMALTPVYADEDQSVAATVRLDKSQESAIGLRTEPAREETVTGELQTVGRVEAQESRTYQVTAGADGWIRHVYAGETGSQVKKGQPLASYYSRDVASPQQGYLYAVDSLHRIGRSATSEQTELATRQMKQAREYLEFLGMTDRQISELERTRQDGGEVTLGTPASGVVLERKVSEGSRFSKGEVLWQIANIESVWVTAELFPEDLASISGVRSATVVLPDGSEEKAAVQSSLPQFEATDRVAKVRLSMSNNGHRLLPGMIVTVRVPKLATSGITVPADAVIETGIRPRLFVRSSDGGLAARAVTTGWRNASRLQILSGLKSGEQVVASGAFLIDSESRLTEQSR